MDGLKRNNPADACFLFIALYISSEMSFFFKFTSRCTVIEP